MKNRIAIINKFFRTFVKLDFLASPCINLANQSGSLTGAIKRIKLSDAQKRVAITSCGLLLIGLSACIKTFEYETNIYEQMP